MNKSTSIIIDELNKNPNQVVIELGNTLLKKSSGKKETILINNGVTKPENKKDFV